MVFLSTAHTSRFVFLASSSSHACDAFMLTRTWVYGNSPSVFLDRFTIQMLPLCCALITFTLFPSLHPAHHLFPCVLCYTCIKNEWLFSLRCHQWGLIYEAHRLERPIKSLFTVKRQDHPKQWQCLNCCEHQPNVYEATLLSMHRRGTGG